MEAKKYKRNPKQNFKVNWSEIIVCDKLDSKERMLLLYILRHHKKHCRYDYKELVNSQICKDLGISTPTIGGYRNGLEDKNFITVHTRINGRLVDLQKEKRKSKPLIYKPNFTKLKKLKLITEENNSFKERYDNQVQSNSSKTEKFPLKAGDQILPEHLKYFKNNKKYKVVTLEERSSKWVKVGSGELILSQIKYSVEGKAIPRKVYYEKYTPPVIELQEGQEITTAIPDKSILEENDEILDKFLKEILIENPEPKDEEKTEEQTEKL